VVDGLDEGALYLVNKMKGVIYYNSETDVTLKAFDIATKQSRELKLDYANEVIPAPNGNQMQVLQYDGFTKTLILSYANGEDQKTIASGTELGGISWSPDQQFIAYPLNGNVGGATAKELYIRDLLSGESARIAVEVENAWTVW